MRSQRRTQARYPANWGQDLPVPLPWLIARLPRRWATHLGRGLGDMFYHGAPHRHHMVRRNVDLCFAEASTEDVPDQYPELRTAQIGRMPWQTNKEKKALVKQRKKATREKGTNDAS